MDYTIEALMDAIKRSDRQFDTERIRQAYDLAKNAHAGQKRLSGEPYLIHPVAVALILLDLGMDSESIEAALLHDVVEDTVVPLSTVEKMCIRDSSLT